MKKIKINGKVYPCRMTMGASLRFKNETGRDLSEFKTLGLAEQVILLWCIVKSACSADGVEFTMELQEFADYLDPDALHLLEDGSADEGAKKKAE